MGEIDIKTKVSDKATALWKRFIKKSPVFIVLTSLTVVSVLGLGVGGALSATGLISNPFASSSTELDSESTELDSESTELDSESTETTLRESTDDYSVPEPVEGQVGDCWFRSLKVQEGSQWKKVKLACSDEVGIEEVTRAGPQAMAESGWTGVRYDFSDQSFLLAYMGTYTQGATLSHSLSLNGTPLPGGRGECVDMGLGTCGITSVMPYTYMNLAVSNKCKAEGDTFTIAVIGAGLNFRESVIMPAGLLDCPTPASTSSPTPESSSEPTTSPTPEASPSPESSSEPESSPTPTP